MKKHLIWLPALAITFITSPGFSQTTSLPTCKGETIFTINDVTAQKHVGQTAFFFESGMAIDADGAPDAYHPDDIGTDWLANACKLSQTSPKRPLKCWALVTETGKSNGKPVIQGPPDPNPGYYISTTALEDNTKTVTDPHRYVNSNDIPFIVLPGGHFGGAKLGDFSVVVNRKNDKMAYAIFADIGPKNKIGEGSIALAKALDINSSPKKGGFKGEVVYVVFPGSGNGKPRPLSEINSAAEKLFKEWGGMEQINACFPKPK